MYPRPHSSIDESKTKITTSFYPLTFFAENIGGDYVEVSTLIPYNSEVHSWQPSISDIANTEDSEVIIYLGAGLDHWVEDDILQSIEMSGKVIMEASTGIELESLEEHGEEGEGHEHEHEEGDPHLWVSPYTALQIAENVYDALKQADPENAEIYTDNWETLESELINLDNKYRSELAPAAGKTFFTTHSAYGYVAHNYDLEQHGLIGLSADEQPSTTKMAQIIETMIEENSYVIYIDPVYSDEYAKTLQSELTTRTGEDVKILKLYLMLGPLDNLDYLEQLDINLDNLKEGLVD
jgi:zinc transport system substrate-binding protein